MFKFEKKNQDIAVKPSKLSKVAIRRHGGEWCWSIIRGIMLLGFAYVILSPLFMMTSKSIMSPEDLYDNSIAWIPKHFSLSTIKICLAGLEYGTSFLNSIWVSGLVTLLQLFACITAGYAFGRFEFPFKKILFGGVILTLIVPPQVILLPTYLNFKSFDIFGLFKLFSGESVNLLNTPLPIFLFALTGNGIKNGLFIYIFRQFFKNMPKETEEAAEVDGAGTIKTFISIMLPAAVNPMVTVILFSFVWQWNDLFYSNLFLGEVKTLSTAFNSFNLDAIASVDPAILKYNTLNASIQTMFKGTAVLLILIPLVILFFVLQRYFVESIERSGVVG